MLRTLVIVSALIAAASARRSSPFGIVGGITDCGSSGRLGTVEVTDCNQTPCHFIPQTTYDIAIRFVSSLTSQNLSLHVYRTHDATLLLEVGINGEIQAGIEYELKFQLPITLELAGTGFDIRFYILDLETHVNEVCAEAAVTIGWA